MAGVQTTDAFSRSDVLRILEINERQLRAWERHGLVSPRTRFEFSNLRELRNLLRLQRKFTRRQRHRRLKHLLDSLRRRTGARRPLLDLKYVWDAPGVVIEDARGRWLRPDTNQLVFNYGPIPPSRALTVELTRPSSDERERLRQGEHWFNKGLEIEERGGPAEEAARAYERSLELNPAAAGAWVNLGTLCYRGGRLEQAESHYLRALDIAPGYGLARFNLGNVYEEAGRLSEAVEQYERAIGVKPDYADAHYNLALAAERLGEPMKAAKHWRVYLKLDPTSPWAGIARQQLQSLLRVTRGGTNSR